MNFALTPPAQSAVAIHGSDALFPVARIFCVGRNYLDHVKEMGNDPERSPPIFFMKPATALVPDGQDVAYPDHSQNLHHEIELVVAIGKSGSRVQSTVAEEYVFGYAVGNDLTRRDLQKRAREAGGPWEIAKAFDHSAPIGAIHTVADNGHVRDGEIAISVNGEIRQQANINQMIWSVPEIIAELSAMFELQAGDLIYTGTPAGVGAVKPGDRMAGHIAGLGTLTNAIV